MVVPALVGCAGFTAKKHTYGGGSGGAAVNGASLAPRVKPEGSDGGSYVFYQVHRVIA